MPRLDSSHSHSDLTLETMKPGTHRGQGKLPQPSQDMPQLLPCPTPPPPGLQPLPRKQTRAYISTNHPPVTRNTSGRPEAASTGAAGNTHKAVINHSSVTITICIHLSNQSLQRLPPVSSSKSATTETSGDEHRPPLPAPAHVVGTRPVRAVPPRHAFEDSAEITALRGQGSSHAPRPQTCKGTRHRITGTGILSIFSFYP